MTGDISDPKISGEMGITDGGYQNLDAGTILTDLTLDTQITPEGALTFELDAKDAGSGTIKTQGEVALDQSGIEVRTVINKAVLVRRDDVTARIDGNIDVIGPINALDVTGEIVLETVEVRLVSNASAGIVDLGDVIIKGEEAEDEDQAESSVDLDLKITSPGRVFVRGRGLDSTWGVDLAVQGTAAQPLLTGRVEKVRGLLLLIGKTFDLSRGRIDFDGTPKIDPRLDIVFERETPDLTGRIVISGKSSDPKLNFTSSPSLPEDEVLPMTIFGKSSQALTGSQAIQLALGVATLMDGGGGTLDQVRARSGWMRCGSRKMTRATRRSPRARRSRRRLCGGETGSDRRRQQGRGRDRRLQGYLGGRRGRYRKRAYRRPALEARFLRRRAVLRARQRTG